MKRLTFDSIIFDMDGTLWDATDRYAEIWNRALESLGYAERVTRDDLTKMMGLTVEQIMPRLLSAEAVADSRLLPEIAAYERRIMAEEGGRLYPGVADGLARLARDYRLFMVSNCGVNGVRNFMRQTGLGPLFEGSLTHGETGLSKAGNIARLVRERGLKAPLYVGDTQTDLDSSREAGVAMLHVSYGFGTADSPDLRADSFDGLVKLLTDKTTD